MIWCPGRLRLGIGVRQAALLRLQLEVDRTRLGCCWLQPLWNFDQLFASSFLRLWCLSHGTPSHSFKFGFDLLERPCLPTWWTFAMLVGSGQPLRVPRQFKRRLRFRTSTFVGVTCVCDGLLNWVKADGFALRWLQTLVFTIIYLLNDKMKKKCQRLVHLLLPFLLLCVRHSWCP